MAVDSSLPTDPCRGDRPDVKQGLGLLPPYFGGCSCGAVRYAIAHKPLTVYVCHCTNCQRSSGTAFTMSMLIDRASFSVTHGEPVPYAVQLATGKPAAGFMCGTCGVRLWRVGRKNPGLLIVRAGTLDQTFWLRPAAHVWTRSAQPWLVLPQGAGIYATQPDGWEELIRLAQAMSAVSDVPLSGATQGNGIAL